MYFLEQRVSRVVGSGKAFELVLVISLVNFIAHGHLESVYFMYLNTYLIVFRCFVLTAWMHVQLHWIGKINPIICGYDKTSICGWP